MIGQWFGSGLVALASGTSKWDGSHVLKAAWLKDTFSPNLDTQASFATDIQPSESVGAGYTAGGMTVGTPTVDYVPANSWTNVMAVSTPVALGAIYRAPGGGNGRLYLVEAAGTTAASAPVLPTQLGATVTDGTAVWTCIGRGLLQFNGTIPGVTMNCSNYRSLCVWDVPDDQPLVWIDTQATQSTGGNSLLVTYTPDGSGIAIQLRN